MTPAPFRWALRGGIARTAHLTPVPAGAATGVVADVYRALEREFGLLAPPVALHSPDPVLLGVAWTLLREVLLVTGRVGRAEKEAVAAGVSLANACPYCVEVHSAVLGGLHDRSDARALGAGRVDDVTDPGLRELAGWARSGAGSPPGPPERVAELVATAAVFHYVNRMVAVFLGDSPLPDALPAHAAGTASAVLGALMAPTARMSLAPGDGLGLPPGPPPGPGPADLAWARPRPHLHRTLVRCAAAVESAGERVLHREERAAVRAALAAHATEPPPGRDWQADALGDGPTAAARLALLTALAPHRVGPAEVDAFRAAHGPRDADLVAVTAWAALTAARDRASRLTTAGRSAAA